MGFPIVGNRFRGKAEKAALSRLSDRDTVYPRGWGAFSTQTAVSDSGIGDVRGAGHWVGCAEDITI